jgi:hypothetical protein
MTVLLPPDLVDRVKNAVYYVPGLTMTAFAEKAFYQAVKELEEKHGGCFPEREGELRRGGNMR